ncbi:MAG: NAD-dependent epimerase/dehydratase family protein [Gemmatimonadetes bacterium]|nr:NAD-dependent epimerase/dehydratase family protein [Gemmatimonadota bacterium]
MPEARTALVTGATGFVGSHVVDELIEAGYRVECTVRPTSDLRWLEGKKVELIEADLSDGEALSRAVRDAEVVIHCAGRTRGSEAELMAANRDGTRALLEACVGTGRRMRFVYCSSQAAAGPGTIGRPREEDDPPDPNSDYGRSKLAGELETRAFADRLEVAVLRPVAVYGPRDEDTLPYFRMAARGVVVVPGVRRRLVQLVHARDVAAALRLTGERSEAVGRTYFAGHPEIVDWRRLSATIAAAVGRRAVRLRVPSLVLRAIGTVADAVGANKKPGQLDRRRARDMSERAWTCRVDRLMEELDWTPKYEAESGLRQTANWYREVGWL